MVWRTGTDARFPYEVRQNVVIGLVVAPFWELEVTGSDSPVVTDGIVIAIDPKQSAERHGRPKECALTKKNKGAIRGSVWGPVSPAKVRHPQWS